MMNADGSHQRRLTGSQLYNFRSGRQMAPGWLTNSTRDRGIAKVTIDANGSLGEEIPLTDSGYDATHPRWSLDGYYIFFTSPRDGNMNLYRMNSDGSGVVQLTFNPAHDAAPSVIFK
jgi:TolB protein